MKNNALNSLSGNAYLELAFKALQYAKRPLSPSEMLSIARDEGFLAPHLRGETMHKTLAARLAEHIRKESQSSIFYRTAPAQFFAHPLAEETGVPDEFKQVFVGNLRTKEIRKENVLVAPRGKLKHFLPQELTDTDKFNFRQFLDNHCWFMDRRSAEDDETVKQFVTFSLLYFENKILIHRRGKFSTASETLKGQISVGFGGHVNDGDFNLFDQGVDAFRGNACRELREELFLDELYDSPEEAYSRTKVLGYLNTDDSTDAEHHLAVIIAFRHSSGKIPKKGELSINQLSWLDLTSPLNDLSDFDLWSGKLLNWLFHGQLKLREGVVG